MRTELEFQIFQEEILYVTFYHSTVKYILWAI